MKTIIALLALVSLLSGCSYFQGGGYDADYGSGQMRSTTGVSTGADADMNR